MLARSLFVVSALALVATGCSVHKIPGTDLDDNDDTRAILDVMERYRTAVEQKDAQTLIGLVSESFKDDGGSTDPEDDLSYKDLYTKLPARLEKLEDIRLELNVKKIEFTEDLSGARATYTYTETFRMPKLSQKPQSETEIKQMIFKRVDKKVWKIVSGV
jgi:hypothetical protein